MDKKSKNKVAFFVVLIVALFISVLLHITITSNTEEKLEIHEPGEDKNSGEKYEMNVTAKDSIKIENSDIYNKNNNNQGNGNQGRNNNKNRNQNNSQGDNSQSNGNQDNIKQETIINKKTVTVNRSINKDKEINIDITKDVILE